MITYKTGNLLDAPAEAIVNTVNTVGVMGKGIALQIARHYPEILKPYQEAVKQGNIEIGKVQVIKVQKLGPVKYIINFPTKKHWRNPSNLEWIKDGLQNLVTVIEEHKITSIALPPLGCGNGGLNWPDVKQEIEQVLQSLPISIIIYEPSENIKMALAKESSSSNGKLTAPRAMLLHLLYKYRALGEEVSEFAAEKLSYFLQRSGEKQLKLDFTKGFYGPYSGKVRHVLYALNGIYIKGFEQKQAKPFEPLELMIDAKSRVDEWLSVNLSDIEKNRLQLVSNFIEGFESPYGLELLATVDFVMQETGVKDPAIISASIATWSDRKANLFSETHIALAAQHILRSKALVSN